MSLIKKNCSAEDPDKRKRQAEHRDYKRIVGGSLLGVEQLCHLIVVGVMLIYINGSVIEQHTQTQTHTHK